MKYSTFLILAFWLLGCNSNNENKIELNKISWIDLSYAYDSSTLEVVLHFASLQRLHYLNIFN